MNLYLGEILSVAPVSRLLYESVIVIIWVVKVRNLGFLERSKHLLSLKIGVIGLTFECVNLVNVYIVEK